MKLTTPKTHEEARALQDQLRRTYKSLIRARERDKPLKVREALADRYIKQLDAMMEYKREQQR